MRTIPFLGYEIDPRKDPEETGGWTLCPVAEADWFEVYPEDVDSEKLDGAATLDEAKQAVLADMFFAPRLPAPVKEARA